MVLRKRRESALEVRTQQLVEKFLLRVAEPEQERLMHLLEEGEIGGLFALFAGLVQGDRAATGASSLAHEGVVQDAEDPAPECRGIVKGLAALPGTRYGFGDHVLGFGRVAAEPPGHALEAPEQREYLILEGLL